MNYDDVSLLISLLFGAGQCVFGVAVLAHGARAGRWRRTGMFLLMVVAAWAMCSGLAELLVSGLAVATRLSGMPTQRVDASIRTVADDALVAVSAALLVPLLVFAAWKRSRASAMPAHNAAEHKE